MKGEAALQQTAVGCGGICELERRLEKKGSSSHQWGRRSLESHILLLWSVNQANSQTGSRCTPTKLLRAACIWRRRRRSPLKKCKTVDANSPDETKSGSVVVIKQS